MDILHSTRFRTILILLVFIVLGLVAQSLTGPSAAVANQRFPMVHDWSMRHEVYPLFGPVTSMLAAQRDPRARFGWHRRLPVPGRWPVPWPVPAHSRKIGSAINRDWS